MSKILETAEYHEPQFLQLQIEGASPEINEALLPYDIIVRVDDETGKPLSFTIENFKTKQQLLHEEIL